MLLTWVWFTSVILDFGIFSKLAFSVASCQIWGIQQFWYTDGSQICKFSQKTDMGGHFVETSILGCVSVMGRIFQLPVWILKFLAN